MHVTWYKDIKKTPEQRQNALRFISNFLLFKSHHCCHIVVSQVKRQAGFRWDPANPTWGPTWDPASHPGS